jgi:hypothetical protein
MPSKLDLILKKLHPHTVAIWSAIIVMVLSGALALRGRMIGIAILVTVGIARWGLPRISRVIQFRSNYRIAGWIQIAVGIIVPVALIWVAFIGLNVLPFIGDVSFRNYKGLALLFISFLGMGYLVMDEIDRPNKYLLPLILISAYALVSFGNSVDPEYLLVALNLIMSAIFLWEWWFSDHLYMKGMARSSLMLALPVAVFTCGQIASQDRLHALFPTGLLIQYFFSLPGLFLGFFMAVYLSRFTFRKSSWILAPLVPVVVSLVLGIEAGNCYWIAFIFGAFLFSLIDSAKIFLLSGVSLATTLLLYVVLPGLHIPFDLIGDELRAALGVSIVVFWLILTLFGNQVRRDWALENMARIRIRRRSRRR